MAEGVSCSHVTLQAAPARVTALGKSDRSKVPAQVGKGYAARTSKAGNKRDAEQLAEEGMETITLVYKKGATALDGLKDMAKQLRRLPTVDLELPTVSINLQ